MRDGEQPDLRIQRILGPAPNALGACVPETNSELMKVEVPNKHKFLKFSHVPYLRMDSITMSFQMYQAWGKASLPPAQALRYIIMNRKTLPPMKILHADLQSHQLRRRRSHATAARRRVRRSSGTQPTSAPLAYTS